MELLPSQKYCITVEEAAIYTGIGERKLREIIKKDKTLDWVLFTGSHIRIKRHLFEEWINQKSFV